MNPPVRPIRPIPTEQEPDVPSMAYIAGKMVLVAVVGVLIGLAFILGAPWAASL